MRRTPSFSERLGEGLILADGAIGTYLHEQGASLDRAFAEMCVSAPQVIERVHCEYADAGAEILTTNSYGANRLQLDSLGLAADLRRINIASARLARQASAGRCYVAGSIGPIGAALKPLGPVERAAAVEVFREQAETLAEGGVDCIFVETISDLEEFEAALEGVRLGCDLPIVVHKTFTEDGTTLMGELPHEVVARAKAAGATAVGANCTVGPQRMVDIIERMAEHADLPLSAMPTAGLPRLVDGTVRYHAEPQYMARYARQIAEAGATIVGGCCGSTPAHIAAMAEALRDAATPAARQQARVVRADAEIHEPTPVSQRSRVAGRLDSDFVVAVDLELPRDHELGDVVDYARSILNLGVDTFMLSDALSSRLVVHPLVMAHRLQDELDVECVLPFHTRDKNMLGIQSDLLAAHVLGIRNVFAAPSDPANLGDYPTTRTLSDVGTDGLVRILDAMNRGQDLAENSIGDPTSFVAIVAGDPGAPVDVEIERLQRAAASGAVAAMTPPQFALEQVADFTDRLRGLLPVVVGVLPLRSAEHADYLHNEIPGIRIPDQVRERMRVATSPATEGLRIAAELLGSLPGVAAGTHVMAPYRQRTRAIEALEAMGLPALTGSVGARDV
ncbi:MAG: bifunctional homocysteine S-methyltransferase/methylenetetrahydrofolate reductase [Acidobacteria bacterium]|nr:bifunctional homocysteine S-methyltransferase/methylenetetrahydrofolate reductase [Acidobacteriota bacterium]